MSGKGGRVFIRLVFAHQQDSALLFINGRCQSVFAERGRCVLRVACVCRRRRRSAKNAAGTGQSSRAARRCDPARKNFRRPVYVCSSGDTR